MLVYRVGADALGSPRGETDVSHVRPGECGNRTPYRRDAEGVVPYDACSKRAKRARYTSNQVYCALDNSGYGKAVSADFTA